MYLTNIYGNNKHKHQMTKIKQSNDMNLMIIIIITIKTI